MALTRTVPTVEWARSALLPALERSIALKAIVFGSVATGKADAWSDIDLIIVARSELPFVERFRDFREVLEAARRSIDLLVYTPEELAQMIGEERGFICRALEEGVVIYERPEKRCGPLA